MARPSTAALVIAAVLALAGCGTQGGASPTPFASAESPPAASSPGPAAQLIDFTSSRYSYSVRLLPGWYVREQGPGTWTPEDLSYVGSGTDSFELDYPGRGTTVDDFPGVTYGMYVSAAPTAPGTTLETWTDELAATMSAESSCQGSPDLEPLTVDGDPAILLVYDRVDCTHDHHVLLASTIHQGRGFAILWLAKRGEADARRSDFDRTLATFRFTR